ncbi:MAG: type VI secretion system-associated FHA domain protein TagH [Steroidobacteraceae bacterium]
MLLALSVISPQGAGMGAGAYTVFDERGGSIGRLPSNDWALPDEEKFVSSRHALIRFSAGAFSLEDVSTNGTFINAVDRPAAKNGPTRLADGDRLYIGDYEILVQLIDDVASSGEPLPAREPLPTREPPSPVNAEPPAARATPELVAPAQALGTNDPLAVIGVGSRSPAPDRGAAASPQAPPPLPSPARAPSPFTATAAAPAPPLAESVPRRSEPSGEAFVPAGGTRELFAALGLDARDVSPEVAGHLGAIVRIVVQGVIEVLRARAEVKNNFRMPMTSIRAIENNPLKFSLNAEDALHNLFVKRNPGFLGPVEAFQEGFQDIASHELAMVAAIRAAYQSMLTKFDPTQLEETYTRKLRRTSVIPLGARLKFWDMYCDQFEDIEKDAESSFQLLFGEEFAKAYHEQLDRLTRAAKSQKK